MENTKLLMEKFNKTYCRLMPSKIEGVGVFAIRDIPKDEDPFQGLNEEKWMKVNPEELKGLDEGVLKLIRDFFGTDSDGGVWIPEFGTNGMNISFFMNESSDPNICTIDGGSMFRALRPINKGEELTINYACFDGVD